MVLGNIARGTKLYVFEEQDEETVYKEYQAVFHYLVDESHFLIKCESLYKKFDSLNRESRLNISFRLGPEDCHFFGVLLDKRGSSDMLLFEQVTDIEMISRRKHARDELHFFIRVFGIAEEKISDQASYDTSGQPDMVDQTFDISTGGLCIITDKVLLSDFSPFFLLEVALSEHDFFMLPAKLVRVSTNPRSRIGRYEYSFQYLAEMSTEVKSRLASATLSKKLMHL